jgi:hypothetical protein
MGLKNPAAEEAFAAIVKGRPMKEWISLDPVSQDRWIDLATEAMEFVGSRH